MYMCIAESNVFYCILCLCIVTVVLLLYLAILATISLNTNTHFTKNYSINQNNTQLSTHLRQGQRYPLIQTTPIQRAAKCYSDMEQD